MLHFSAALGTNCAKPNKAWMLNVLSEQIVIKAENGQEAPLDFAYAWSHSDHSRKLKAQLSEISNTRDEKLEIVYKNRFAASKWQRYALVITLTAAVNV